MPRYPYKKSRYKSKYPSKKKKSKRRDRSVISTISPGISTPFPISMIVKHKYVETITLTPGALLPTLAYYSANSLFDPRSAVGGHQPIGYDQMTPIYDHYLVLGAKMTVNCFSTANSPTNGTSMMFITLNDDTSAVGTYDTVMEQSLTAVKPLTASDGKGHVKLVKNFSAKKYFGVTDLDDNSKYQGASLSSPADQAFFVLGTQALNTSASDPVACVIEIEYIAKWTELRTLVQS